MASIEPRTVEAPPQDRGGAKPTGTSRDELARAQLARLILRLEAEGAHDLLPPLRECGQPLTLVCQGCGHLRLASKWCGKRWCPRCASRVSAKRLVKYERPLLVMQSPIFLTLTMPHTEETSTPDDIRRLRRAFGALRRRAWWRRRVAGGIASVEVTSGEHGWHPHVHALIDARWLSVTVPPPTRSHSREEVADICTRSQAEVSWQWAACLSVETAHIWVSRAKTDRVAREILKYAVKPADLVESSEPIAPMIRTLARSRLISAWGSVRAERLRIQSLTDEAGLAVCECKRCGDESWIPLECTPRARFRSPSMVVAGSDA